MFDFIFRKTIFKGYPIETQNFLVKMWKQFFTIIFFNKAFLYLAIPLLAIDILVLLKAKISVILLFIFIYALIFIKEVSNPKIRFYCMFSCYLHYFDLVTKKGKAITKSQFKLMSQNNEKLYADIIMWKYKGYCYAEVFSILSAIKEGRMYLVSIRDNFAYQDNIPLPYTMHALYTNNNWVYDPYNQKQYPLDKYKDIDKEMKIYKVFEFKDIAQYEYDEWRKSIYEDLVLWCKYNDVSENLMGD